MNFSTSNALFERAKQHIPGGVNSPVRAFKSVGGNPIFMQSAKGSHLVDVDGNTYIDYINSWGPMILGHAHPRVVEAIREQATKAISFGAPTEAEERIAKLIKKMAPNVDLVRLVNSGTEACMSALRLARGFTGRNKLIKFEGCYHGHADAFLVKAGSGVATLDIKQVAGITSGVASDTLTATYNDFSQVQKLVAQHKGEIAAIIIEPVAGNMGCVVPHLDFLRAIRELCTEQGIVLIFDEVMTGFRLARGGAQECLGIDADLVTYGKVIGGGMPIGAFGGKRAIMECIAPVGQVYQAGTLSGNPLAVACGYATLSLLEENPSIYQQLEEKGKHLKKELHAMLQGKGIPHTINQLGSMMSVHFGEKEVTNFETATQCDIPLFNRFFHHMLSQGVYLPPSAFESWFLCDSLSTEDIEKTLHAVHLFRP